MVARMVPGAFPRRVLHLLVAFALLAGLLPPSAAAPPQLMRRFVAVDLDWWGCDAPNQVDSETRCIT